MEDNEKLNELNAVKDECLGKVAGGQNENKGSLAVAVYRHRHGFMGKDVFQKKIIIPLSIKDFVQTPICPSCNKELDLEEITICSADSSQTIHF